MGSNLSRGSLSSGGQEMLLQLKWQYLYSSSKRLKIFSQEICFFGNSFQGVVGKDMQLKTA